MGIVFDEANKRHMGQRYAKHQMQSGVRVYHQRHYQQAIARWRAALSRLRNAEDRFITLGYMAQAFCDCSDYESMLHYALQQMELANARHDDFMKSEALLNLSKAYERLADYGKAVNYGRASLQHPNIDARTPGYAHFGIALAHLGLSQFQMALEEFERAMAIAGDTGDKLLELQICVGLGTLFTILRDLSKALIFLRNALSILQLVTADNVHAKYKSTILYQLSVVLRLKGSLADARQVCDEALRLAYQTSNRATYARTLASMADINRELGESEAKETITKSWARYEQAFRIMRQIKDRMGEALVLGSMAKSASESRSHYTGQCECQAIQLNRKCLELAKMIGCKHVMMKCHLRLQELYGQLEDDDSEDVAAQACVALIQEMELFCNFCGQRYGDRDDSLQALRCSHIFHEKCLHKFLAEGEDLSCPKCKRKAIVMDHLNSQRSPGVACRKRTNADIILSSACRTEHSNDATNIPLNKTQALPGRRELKLTPLNIPLYDTPDTLKQQTLSLNTQEQQFQEFETTAPITVGNSTVKPTHAQAKATVRIIPRTTSVPLADAGVGDVIYASSDYLREYGTTSDVFSLANRMLEDATDSLRHSASPLPTSSTATSSSIRTLKAARTRPKSLLAAGASSSHVNELDRLSMEIGAESCPQKFSLSASTSSIAFYQPSGIDNRMKAIPLGSDQHRKMMRRDDSGAGETSGAPTNESSYTNTALTFARRFPSRAERMRVMAATRHFASEDTTLACSSKCSALSVCDETAESSRRPSTFQKQSQTNSFGRANSFMTDFKLKSLVGELANDAAAVASQDKKPLPSPPKPCCGSSNAFPTFSDELMNAPPPSLAFPSMLERAMRTVLEEESEETHRSNVIDTCIVEYSQPSPAALFVNNIDTKPSHSPKKEGNASTTQLVSEKLDDQPNCDDEQKSMMFVVRHGAGVTDL